jgi:hypothetical protein
MKERFSNVASRATLWGSAKRVAPSKFKQDISISGIDFFVFF